MSTRPRPLDLSPLSVLAPVLAMALLLAGASTAQVQVRYGDPVQSGTITAPNQTVRYLLAGAQKGDTLRIAFSSQNSGCCSYYYYHRLEVLQGTTSIAKIEGLGTLTVTIPVTGFYTIQVRARNGQSAGWYAFQVDRLNDPVGAERIAFNWNMRGTLSSRAQFDVYTLRAEKDSNAVLRFTCQNSGCCSYYYYHYVEIVDAAGKQVAAVHGNGAGGTPFTFKAAGVYTIFVAARNWQYAGWYALSVECQSWPAAPCDTVAHSSNYCQGWPGTNGVPSLATAAPPRIGRTVTIDVGNSYGKQTAAWLLVGSNPLNLELGPYGGTLCVGPPFLMLPLTLPPGGTKVDLPIPNEPLLLGIGGAAQALVSDPGATPGQVAFSRGLLLVLGR